MSGMSILGMHGSPCMYVSSPCMYVSMYASMSANTHIHGSICMYACIHINMNADIHIYIKHVDMLACMQTCMNVFVYLCLCMYM